MMVTRNMNRNVGQGKALDPQLRWRRELYYCDGGKKNHIGVTAGSSIQFLK